MLYIVWEAISKDTVLLQIKIGEFYLFIFFMTKNSSKVGLLCVFIRKLQTHIKHLIHMDRIIFRLCQQASSKELLIFKEDSNLRLHETTTKTKTLTTRTNPFEFRRIFSKNNLLKLKFLKMHVIIDRKKTLMFPH
jgi:hypothetical protein